MVWFVNNVARISVQVSNHRKIQMLIRTDKVAQRHKATIWLYYMYIVCIPKIVTVATTLICVCTTYGKIKATQLK